VAVNTWTKLSGGVFLFKKNLNTTFIGRKTQRTQNVPQGAFPNFYNLAEQGDTSSKTVGQLKQYNGNQKQKYALSHIPF